MMLLRQLQRLRCGTANASHPPTAPVAAPSRPLRAIVFDWGDTLMRDFPQYAGPMAGWPKVRSMPGVHAGLARVPGHLVCCVASGAGDSDCHLLGQALARVRIRHHFRHLLTCRELGAHKPDPAFYHAVCRRLEVRPGQVLMVGDSLGGDIRPAKAVGMRTVWITRLKLASLPAEADAAIASLRDLDWALSRIT